MDKHGPTRAKLNCALTAAVPALAAALLFAAPASAATLQVTSAADSGDGSLRAAVAAAADGDVVAIQAGVNPALSSGEIAVDDSITIRGQGSSATTVSAGGTSRVFRISGGEVVIEDVALTAGRAPSGDAGGGGLPGGTGEAGGAILNQATASLTLRRMLIVNSAAGNGGAGGNAPLPILSPGAGGDGGRGGAIASFGSLRIEDSTLGANRAGNGGAPGSGGLSQPAGGGGGSGGAIYVDAGPGRTTALENVTIAGNAAGNGVQGGGAGAGGAIFSSGGGANGSIVVRHATISANRAGSGATGASGGGISAVSAAGALVVQNSILAANTPGGNCSGAVGDGQNNIAFPAGSCPSGFSNEDPDLDAGGPADNGGPTPTIEITAGSPAVNQVAPQGENCTARDQRGFERPQGPACDIGAFEVRAPACEDRAVTVKPGGRVKVKMRCGGPGNATIGIRSEPDRGKLSGFDEGDGTVTYEAPRRFRGTDTFTYGGENAVGQSAAATVTVTVEGPFPPSNKIRFGKISLDREKGTAKLPVIVPGRGKLRVFGKGVRDVRRTVKKKGRVKLPIKPAKQARRRLKRQGVATVTAKVAFTPRGGFTRTRKREVRLRVNSFFVPI